MLCAGCNKEEEGAKVVGWVVPPRSGTEGPDARGFSYLALVTYTAQDYAIRGG